MFVLMCVTTAAVLTPADILSMLVLAAAFGLIFFAGWMYSVGRTSPTASDQ